VDSPLAAAPTAAAMAPPQGALKTKSKEFYDIVRLIGARTNVTNGI